MEENPRDTALDFRSFGSLSSFFLFFTFVALVQIHFTAYTTCLLRQAQDDKLFFFLTLFPIVVLRFSVLHFALLGSVQFLQLSG
jgi:hypothetical protein